MHTRKLGNQGLEVSAVGLGIMGMAGGSGSLIHYGPADEAESMATIHRALEIGVTVIDTAEVYGPFTNEELLGRALKGKRDRAIIATKFGFKFEDGRISGVDSRPEHLRRVVDESLQRLGTDHIDLWYQHRLDRAVPIEDKVGAMAWLACGTAVLLLASPLKLLWARASLGWFVPFVLWGVLIVAGAVLARRAR